MAEELSFIERYRKRYTALRTQMEQWRPQWQEINDHILPRARFQPLADQARGGEKKYQCIINNVASLALRTATAGMVSGLTSPSRPWYRLTTPDPDLAEFPRVRAWLHLVNERQLAMFAKSNIYQVLTAMYFDLLGFGTTLSLLDEDDRTVMRGYHAPLGSYVLACSARGRPDTMMREIIFTVRQLVQKFGIKNLSKRVTLLVDDQKWDENIEVCHTIEPNEAYEPGKLTATAKAFRSSWYEKTNEDLKQPLRESGLSEQRILAPRWMVLGDDTYGTTCPGMEMLGDAKAIPAYERSKALVIEMLAKPPKAVPAGMSSVSLQPGKITNIPANAGPHQQAYSLVEVNPTAIAAIAAELQILGQRINRTGYAELWMTLALGDTSRQMTAEEVRARVEEKIVQLAPVLLRLNDELLEPLIDTSYAMLDRAGLIPPPPEELYGVDLKVEFVSMLHQMQQSVALGGIERLSMFVKTVHEYQPTVVDKANVDEWIDEYAKTLGLPPNMVFDDDQVAQARAARAKAQQAAALAASVQVSSDAAHKLGNTPMTGDTALSRLAGLTSPGEAALQESGAAAVA